MNSNDTLLSVEETATMLRVHSRTILRRVNDGTIKSIRIGGIIRIPREQFRFNMVIPTATCATL